ncbi:MAG: hypothetical protein QOJ93_2297 [Actinomycetota bacterium]|jgi:prepilin-type N-terminal cleavage/methylation domain-containing protein|nr:hypothetical protein [Actinomycetota bacterium]
MSLNALRYDEGGFTLVELLITIVILGIVVPALAAGVVSILHNSATTTQRLYESHDAQIAAAYFANDVQGADVPVPSTDSRCDKAGTTAVVRFAWTEYDTAAVPAAYKVVVYSKDTSVGTVPVLRRRFCQGTPNSAALSATPVSDVVIAHYLSSVTAPSVCLASCSGQPASSIVLTAVEQSGYTFKVAGVRRAA